ncbi:hypothetical protein Mal64_10090 [Pseudobythopirellula maris]|uniref:Uncharacterized protein n=1 Tax=Pseudobythopirellula maris TaxID=2527991 RepID=A0A5C5ZU53_9BACT|nr:hypothetical protein [Pseudobythopirellula maris]TWT90615.1 hypothetical protein Mal64_10090 [Pseudobythopirellula maris]
MSDTPKPRTGPRFSLLSLLVLTAITVLVAVLWVELREVGPLRREVRRLREQSGLITVDDRTRPHALMLKSDSPFEWRWLVWLPESSGAVVRVANGGVPITGLPAEADDELPIRTTQEPLVVSYRIHRDPVDNWLYGTLSAEGRVAIEVGDDLAWPEFSPKVFLRGGVTEKTQSFAPGKPVELLRLRAAETTNVRMIPNPADGVMIWLEMKP